MSKQAKLLNYLSTGAEVTAKQISGSFGLKNPHDAIFQLRKQGVQYINTHKKLDFPNMRKVVNGKKADLNRLV